MYSEYEDSWSEEEFAKLPDVDPTKIKIELEPKYLNQEVSIRIRATDEKTFKDVMTCLELFKKAFDEEIRQILDDRHEH